MTNGTTSQNPEQLLETIVAQIRSYLPAFDEKKFRDAFIFAEGAHEGQTRKSEEPYILHPLETVAILARLRVDEDTLISALLHDVPEDTNRTLAEIDQHFGKKVAYLVDGITKLSKVYYRHDMEERQIESLKKLLLHSAKDARVILIKLADRLHNMRTIHHIDKEEKRQRIAKETLEIYVPIANLLGIEEIKREIEDLCFSTLMPQEHEHIRRGLEKSKEWQEKSLNETVELLSEELRREDLRFEISGREKSLYSIFKKIVHKGLSVEQGVNDFLALRLIVPDRISCYRVLGVIHKLFKPMPGRVKDYIAVPKNNGYQSLHTTVFGIKGTRTEFQIRTEAMHLEAEYGIAAHYFYDQNKQQLDIMSGKRAEWVRKILELQKDQQDSKDFLENLKVDIFQDKIFIFTPKGDVIDLPQGATPVDFAYAIHTDIGNKALRADVNGKPVQLTTPLRSGDTVHIFTSPKRKGPKREWLLSVKTNQAKANIRSWLRKESRENKYKIGRTWLQREFDRLGLGLVEDIPGKVIKEFLEKYPYATFDDVLVAVGEGALSPENVMQRLYPGQRPVHMNILTRLLPKFFQRRRNRTQENSVGILLSGQDRFGMLQNIVSAVTDNGANFISLDIKSRYFSPTFTTKMFIEVKDLEQLRTVFEHLERIEGVTDVQRFFSFRQMLFFMYSGLLFLFWVAHLVIMYRLGHRLSIPFLSKGIAPGLLLYAGLGFMLIMIFYLKRLSRKSFSEIRETHRFWILMYSLVTFVLATVSVEAFWLSKLPASAIPVSWLTIFVIMFLIYTLLTVEYLSFRKNSGNVE